ncbi:MAG TPA: GxxExxY protein [Gemmatimonadaceae bacterium]|nr:GxxExxY protein [Gemmatimonadaceae bacterium]
MRERVRMELDDQASVPSEDQQTERYPHSRLTNAIIGGAFNVHGIFGGGFLESVYANALTVELRSRGLHVERHVVFELFYRGTRVGRYVADLVVEGTVVVETKAARAIEAPHRAQLLNYLRASGLEVGLVLNFATSVQFKRVVSTAATRPASHVRQSFSEHNGNGNGNT